MLEFKKNLDKIPEGIKQLQNVEKLYLYGNGINAERIYALLKQWNIHIKGVVVSDEFHTDVMFHEFRVQVISSVKEKICIIAGYNICRNEELNEQLLSHKMIDKIFSLNGLNYCVKNGGIDRDITLVDVYFPNIIKRHLDYDYFKENMERFIETYTWLEDEQSKITMECYLKGHIELKGWPMLPVWNKEMADSQYFSKDIISLSDQEVVVDCGAYIGDTLESFCKQVSSFDKYYAFEPDESKKEIILENILKVKEKGKAVHKAIGAWDKKETVMFKNIASSCGQISDTVVENEEYEYINVDRIDDLIEEEENISFIKMDIEGAELKALMGAERTIQKCKPKLAICIYHRREDLITIPQYIKKLVPEYKLFLRAHLPIAREVVLYAIKD